MSNQKWTPGPWSFVIEDGDNHIYAHGESIMCDMDYYPWVPGNKNDWSLIAAAPELYEALENVLDSWQYGESITEGQDVYNAARAALAKARGEV